MQKADRGGIAPASKYWNSSVSVLWIEYIRIDI